MFNPFDVLNPNLIIFLGMIGLFLGIVFSLSSLNAEFLKLSVEKKKKFRE